MSETTGRYEGRVRIGDGEIAYTTAGTGAPLLLIHGLGGPRRTWDRVLDSFTANHTVIALTYPVTENRTPRPATAPSERSQPRFTTCSSSSGTPRRLSSATA